MDYVQEEEIGQRLMFIMCSTGILEKKTVRNRRRGQVLGLAIAKLWVEKMAGRIEATADSKYLTITCAFEKAE